MNLLQMNHVCAGYGNKEIVHDVSLEIGEGQIVGILGQNGCGKSTLMKAICGGIASRGEMVIDGRNLQEMSEKELARICSYVPQKSGLLVEITALEAVLMGFHPYLGMLERPSTEMRDRAKELLGQVGLEQYITSNYMELSEGQKRLCILARGLVTDAKLLLLDEPDASVDFCMKNVLLQMVSQKVRQKRVSALCTLHDTNLALSYCDTVYLMKQGRFQDSLKPKQESIAEMERKLSLIYGEIRLLEYFGEKGDRQLTMVQA